MGIKVQDLINCGSNYFEKMEGQNSREFSWSYCYKAFAEFRRKKLTEKDADYLALHLTTYLANWGMYRGSSFLLKETNYKVHIPVVKILLSDKYEQLQNLCDVEKVELLDELKREINVYYKGQRTDSGKDITDTLFTKILLGTIGCVPAYDTNLCIALKLLGISRTVNKKSVTQIIGLYRNNKDAFDVLAEKATMIEGISDYPIMRVMDACLWQYGYDWIEK